MPLPTSGLITATMINLELGRAEGAAFSLNDAVVRALAGKTSGAISFGDFYGKSSEIVKYITTSGGALTLQSLFTAAEWSSETNKRVILNSGIERGSGDTAVAAISVGALGWGGELLFSNLGTISGAGGTAISGNGGTALAVNRVGLSGQKILISNSGTLRGGGGAGGRGGTGGRGSFTQNITEGPFFSNSWPQYRWESDFIPPYSNALVWNVSSGNTGVILYPPSGQNVTSFVHTDGWTYTRGSFKEYGEGPYMSYTISRFKASTVEYTGGSGGDGGVGQGWGRGAAAGKAGGGAVQTSGAGGVGGSGGSYGENGQVGKNGETGNLTAGAAGTSGGLAGYACEFSSNVVWQIEGTRLGRL